VEQGLGEEERSLTLQNFVDFLAPTKDSDVEIYLPFHTITPSEQRGMSLVHERLLRKYGCSIIRKAGIMLRLP
jgi:hypothetical protein